MEARGWIYYWHNRASPNALGSAVLGVQKLIQPGAERVLEMRQNQRAERLSNPAAHPGRKA